MEIKINKSKCTHLRNSFYNSNIYELPFEINGCNTIQESYFGDDSFNGCSIGIINKEGKYESLFYLHQNDREDDCLYINSETIDSINRWT